MNPDQGQITRIPLGKGRLFSSETVATLKRAITSNSLAMDWAKGRLVMMVFSLFVLIFLVVGILNLVAPHLLSGKDEQDLMAPGSEGETPAESSVGAEEGSKLKLRNDLFDVPKPTRKQKPKEPKTNPVELLRLIELQGVLGGDNPRAMVLYKRTKETVTVSVGDDLGDFEVVEIRERSVVLKWRDELFELSL